MEKNIHTKGEKKLKIILIGPYALAHKKVDIMNEIFSSQDAKVVRSKQVIVNKELAEKHFSYLPENERNSSVMEWSGTIIEAMLIEGFLQLSKEVEALVYVSDAEKAEADMKLWFPEF